MNKALTAQLLVCLMGVLLGLCIMFAAMLALGYQRVPPEFQGMEGHWHWMPGPEHPMNMGGG